MKIGIVGLGIMGRGMADNFLKNGHKLYVWNRTASVTERFAKQGAVVCSSPAEVTQRAQLVFEVTANDESSRQVWAGKDGILSAATSKNLLVASSTLSIGWFDELAQKCAALGLRIFDVPLTGGRVGAETGSLTLLMGGDKKLLEKLKPTFDAIAAKQFYFGPVGHGMRYKLILNYLQASHVIAFGQAMKIAKSSGMDLERVAQALVDRPGGVITQIASTAYFADPVPVTFSIEWITKDLSYAKKFARSMGSDASVLELVLKEYKKVLKAGHSGEDWASVNKLIELLATPAT